MKRVFGIAVMAALLAMCASGAMAVWVESFEGYAPGVALSLTNSAWTGGHLPGSSTIVGPTNSTIGAGTGYSASQGWYAPVSKRGRAYRIPDAGDQMLSFRFHMTQPSDITYSRDMHVFMTTDDEYETTYGSSVTGPSVGAEFYWESWSVVSRFGYTGNKQVRYLQTNTWYDVKMTLLNSSTVEYAYKRSEDPEWTTLTGDIPTGFSYNYVNLESGSWFRSDLPPVYVDDIATGDLPQGPEVQAPTFNPDAGIITGPTSVTITCATPGATIRYTTNQSDPSETNGTIIADGSSVVVNPGTTLKAKAWKSGMSASPIKTALYSLPVYHRPYAIPRAGAVTIDGDLSDWADAVWAPIDQDYHVAGSIAGDVNEAYYSAKWSENKVYVAVKVKDAHHQYLDSYTAWDARDAVEIYIHTTGIGSGTDYSVDQAAAQQYTVGLTTNGASVWSAIGSTYGGVDLSPAEADAIGFAADGGASGEWLIYEAALTPYESLNRDEPASSVASPLSAGDVIGFDVTVACNDGTTFTEGFSTGYVGMLGENMMTGKSSDYGAFGQHLLVAGGSIAEAKTIGDGLPVSTQGIVTAVFGDIFYIGSPDRSNGIRVLKAGHGTAPGYSVLVTGTMATLTDTGERYIDARYDPVSGAMGQTMIEPLGMNNKTVGGSGVDGGSGLDNVGILVRTFGRVINKDQANPAKWFTIDDGSGVVTRVVGNVPSGLPYVAVTGISSCELINGEVARAILATSQEVVDE